MVCVIEIENAERNDNERENRVCVNLYVFEQSECTEGLLEYNRVII